MLQNPKDKDKARIYILRKNSFVGYLSSHYARIEFDPIIEGNGQPSTSNYQDVLCFIGSGEGCWADIKAGTPVNISTKVDIESLNKQYILFTPQAGRTYCLQFNHSGIRTFLDKNQCEELYISLEDDWDKTQKKLAEWRKKYLKKEKNPRLPSSLIRRSFDHLVETK